MAGEFGSQTERRCKTSTKPLEKMALLIESFGRLSDGAVKVAKKAASLRHAHLVVAVVDNCASRRVFIT